MFAAEKISSTEHELDESTRPECSAGLQVMKIFQGCFLIAVETPVLPPELVRIADIYRSTEIIVKIIVKRETEKKVDSGEIGYIQGVVGGLRDLRPAKNEIYPLPIDGMPKRSLGVMSKRLIKDALR